MKTKYTLAILTMGMSVAAMAQEVDDMYFTSRDRAVVRAATEVSMIRKYQQEDLNAVRSNPVNPSDSYSGRGVNPEYTAQSKKGMSVVQENPDYFLSSYQPKNVNQSLYNGSASAYSNPCSCNSSFGNPYYGGMGYGGFGSPYSMYSPYGMSPYGMYSPYSSMSMGMGYGFGGYNPGFYGGMGYGMGSMYGMSSMYMGYGMGSMYGMGGMYGNPYYGYGYPGTVVVVPADISGISHGRRSARSTSLNNYVDNTRSTSVATTGAAGAATGRVRDGSRMSSSSQPNYYDPSWRNNANNFQSRSSYYDNNSSMRGTGWNNSSFDNGSRNRSAFDNMGGGSRSSFGSGGGFSGGGGGGASGGGGGHSRGRN